MKKLVALFSVAALTLSLMACGTTEKETANTGVDYSNTTITGKVLSLEGTTATLQLGELGEGEMTLPEGMDPDLANMPSGGRPSDMPQGERPDNMPEREAPEGGDFSGMGGGFPNMGGAMTQFIAGEETATLNLEGASISIESMEGTTQATIADIMVDDVLVIEVGANNAVTSITVKFIMNFDGMGEEFGGNMGGQPGGFGGSGEVNQGTSANTIEEDGTVLSK